MGRIAIIDDSVDALELFAFVLKGGHEILTFAAAEKFLGEFRPGSFDLILLDLVMPGVDGFEVFQRIRMQDADVPVVAVTARAEEAERKKALDAGFCDYFTKPIREIEQFRDTVFGHVGRCSNPLAERLTGA